MNRLTAGIEGRRDQVVPDKIALGRRRRADTNRLIRQPDMEAVPVGGGIDRHGFDPHFPASTDDSYGDFAPVGNEQALYQETPLTVCRASRIKPPKNRLRSDFYPAN
jgi:hypothetical protein